VTTLSTDQGLVLPTPPDGDNVPLSFAGYNTGVESRLVKRYLSAADRTARNPTPATGELSFRADQQAYEWYTGSAWSPFILTGAWSSYPAEWSSTGTAPSVGNGTLIGRWAQIGRTVFVRIQLTLGTTSNAGSGAYRFSLPVTPQAGSLLTAFVIDASAGSASWAGAARITLPSTTGDNMRIVVLASTTVGSTVPFTWTTSDQLFLSGHYEAA
jgi:hypothetical protein